MLLAHNGSAAWCFGHEGRLISPQVLLHGAMQTRHLCSE